MQAYLKAISVWKSVVARYTDPKKVKTSAQKEAKKNNSMAMEAILEGLADIQKKKIGKCISARELWLKLEQYYSNKEEEVEVMELMIEDLTDLQKEKIGKCNLAEELSFKINQLNEEQEAEDESIQHPGKYEGMFPEPLWQVPFSICESSLVDSRYGRKLRESFPLWRRTSRFIYLESKSRYSGIFFMLGLLRRMFCIFCCRGIIRYAVTGSVLSFKPSLQMDCCFLSDMFCVIEP